MCSNVIIEYVKQQEKIPLPNEIGLFSFDFDENTLDDIGTIKASISMFADLGLIEKFDIPYEVRPSCSHFC